MPRIHTLEIKLRELPANLPSLQIKKLELNHSLELMTSLFRVIGLVSFEQTWLHVETNRMHASTKIEEFDRAIQLIGELGTGISNFATTLLEEIVSDPN